ncbi:MAG: type II CAAX prenyl endopeptidase Rce1 family protein [Planctomycetota bacterium]
MQEYFSNGRLGRLCLKELRESLRDRRTIITLILMPILVYPLLSMAMQRLIVGAGTGPRETKEYIFGVPDEETAVVVNDALMESKRVLGEGIRPSIEIVRTDSASKRQPLGKPTQEPKTSDEQPDQDTVFQLATPQITDVSQALRDGELDLAARKATRKVLVSRDGRPFSVFEFEMEFREGDLRSEAAMLEFRKSMQRLNDYQSALLRGPSLPAAVQLTANSIGQRIDPTASLAGILPLVLILMTITGAVYPAIDLTAGERERGTMEAMIATPAPRFVLLLSKYVAVVTVAVLTALANLLASWITLSIGGLGRALLGEQGFSLMALVQILPLLVIFAAFFSAILLAMCSFARSFKEAQAYLIPVMLVSLAPALVTLMPNIEFSTWLGVVPLVNILLLSRDIMTGSPVALPAFAAVFSTLTYAAAALVVASRLFGAESATAGSQETWTDLIQRPRKARAIPDLGELAIYLAFLFPIFFIITNLVGEWFQEISLRLWANASLLVILFLIAPAIFAWYRKLSLSETFLLNFGASTCSKPFALRVLIGLGWGAAAVLLGLGLWVIAYELMKTLSDFGFGTLSIEKSDSLEALKNKVREIPFWVFAVTSAVTPAIAEEFFFRGFVLSAFRHRLSTLRAIAASALLFALFHVINGSVLSIERFFPTLLLGLVLGWIAVRTGSLWPGILTHAIHNGLLFWLNRFDEKELQGWFGTGNEHFSYPWIAASLLVVGTGLLLLLLSTSSRSHENVP